MHKQKKQKAYKELMRLVKSQDEIVNDYVLCSGCDNTVNYYFEDKSMLTIHREGGGYAFDARNNNFCICRFSTNVRPFSNNQEESSS